MLHSMLHSWSSLSAPSFFWKVSHFRMTFCSLRSKPIFFVARQMSAGADLDANGPQIKLAGQTLTR